MGVPMPIRATREDRSKLAFSVLRLVERPPERSQLVALN